MVSKNIKRENGFTLLELILSVLLIGIIVAGFSRVYYQVAKGIVTNRAKTIAVNLAGEKIESLKNLSYWRLIPTPQDALDNPDDPKNPYPPEKNIIVGEKIFQRYTVVKKVQETESGIVDLLPSDPDDGLKKITITIKWEENGKNKEFSLNSLFENPERSILVATVNGKITDSSSGDNIIGARVEIVGNPNYTDISNNSGNYSIRVSLKGDSDLFTIRASERRYEPEDKLVLLSKGEIKTVNFSLDSYPTGKIEGIVKDTDSVVIAGAIVTADDGISNRVISSTTGYFLLNPVKEGVWNVYATSGSLSGNTPGIIVNEGEITVTEVVLDTITTTGYITGNIKDTFGSPIENILVRAGVGSAYSDSDGNYKINVDSDTYIVVANPGFDNTLYDFQQVTGVVVNSGEVSAGINFILRRCGMVSGKITINGVDPLPGIVIHAIDRDNYERSSVISGDDGTYLITGLPILKNPYIIEPILDSGDTSNPQRYFDLVLSEGSIFGDRDFVITPKWGKIIGAVKEGGTKITTGVLIIATTSTISGNYIEIDEDFRKGSTVYYGTDSLPSGDYTLEVRRGYTYNIYAWYTKISDGTVNITRKEKTGVNFGSGETTKTINFDW